jgi:hypothetical protein
MRSHLRDPSSRRDSLDVLEATGAEGHFRDDGKVQIGGGRSKLLVTSEEPELEDDENKISLGCRNVGVRSSRQGPLASSR